MRHEGIRDEGMVGEGCRDEGRGMKRPGEEG